MLQRVLEAKSLKSAVNNRNSDFYQGGAYTETGEKNQFFIFIFPCTLRIFF